MKINFFLTAAVVCCLLQANAQQGDYHIPQLIKTKHVVQLVVDNKPYLIFGGELGNSTASSNTYMQPVWKKLQQMNLNTVIAPVYWELLEPVENKFNFSMVDSLIINARRYKLKLVLLWFGSWKNSMSCYVPAWIKTNTEKYPRVIDRQGTPQEILSPFSKSNEGADKKAFVQLIQHIKQTDNKQNTVIAIQVENEMGMLPNARGYEAGASAAFANNVPEKLMNYLQAHKTNLTPEIKTLWEENGFKTSGNWETVFGKSLLTDEIFTAWHLACYANEIAQSGKKIYGLPMYVNAALNRPNWLPGQYPGGGPLPHLKTIWDAAAPSIDILAPDIYFPDFKNWCDKYTQTTNPLFIPEIRFEKGDDAKAFFAFGNYNCLSFSPFSIESTGHPEEEPIGKAYHVLRQISHLITKYQPENNVKGALLSKDSFTSHFISGNYELTVSHEYTLGWSAGSKDSTWPLAGCLIIHVAPDEFYVAGTGVVVTFKSTNPAKKAGFISVDEGYFENKKWIPGRRMNGDEDHQGRHVRIPCNEYSTQHIQLYTY